MPSGTQEYAVFIASPGDCEAEREAVRRVADQVNKHLGVPLRRRLRVVGWEGVVPDIGRPQSQINPLVDDCDVFIGLLGHRWGTPTGTHSSGFLEEYERAVTRRAETGSPRMSLYFRSPLSAMLSDPGPELSQVLEFKRGLRQGRVLLYKSFDEVSAFENLLWPLLSETLLDGIVPAGHTENEGTDSAAVQRQPSDDGLEDPDVGPARAQVALATDSVTQAARGVDIDYRFDDDRLLLVALALNRDGGPLPAHVANRLFARRKDLALLGGERDLWLRSLLGDVGRSAGSSSNRVVPGWLTTQPTLDDLIGELERSESHVVSGVLQVLDRRSLRPAGLWSAASHAPARWRSALKSSETHRAAMSYLARHATRADHELLDELAEGDDLHDIVELRGALAGDPTDLLKAIGSRGYQPAWKLGLAASNFKDVHLEQLKTFALSKHAPDGTRQGAIREWARRTPLTEEDLVDLVKIPSGADEVIRMVEDGSLRASPDAVARSVSQLTEASMRLGLQNRLRAATTPVTDLLDEFKADLDLDMWESLSWKSGPELAEVAEVVDLAREIYDTDVELPIERLPESWHDRPDLLTFIRANARTEALRVLVNSSSLLPAEDRDRLRKEVELDSGYDKQLALRWLADAASEADLEFLFEHLPAAYPEGRDDVIDALLRVGGSSAARRLLTDAEEHDVPTRAVGVLGADPATEPDELIELLYSPLSQVRMDALAELIRRADTDLDSLLGSYPADRESHYYNVICEIDEVIFFRTHFDTAEKSTQRDD